MGVSGDSRDRSAGNDRRAGHRAARPEARWLLLLAGASIAAGLAWDALFGRAIPLRPEAIRDWLDGQGAWAPLIFVALMTLAVVVSPIPSVPLDIAAGLAFGLFWGTVYTLIGAELGAIIAFGLARRLGRGWLVRRLPEVAMARIDGLATRQGVRAILLMRLLPVFNFDWVSYAAGLTAIPFPAFALATLLGMIPPVVAIVAVGAALPTQPVLAGAIFGLLILAVVVPLVAPWLPRPWRGARRGP
jgi:uncharacterized membrane protein YdjX (TVP38/TMEM64 family)